MASKTKNKHDYIYYICTHAAYIPRKTVTQSKSKTPNNKKCAL